MYFFSENFDVIAKILMTFVRSNSNVFIIYNRADAEFLFAAHAILGDGRASLLLQVSEDVLHDVHIHFQWYSLHQVLRALYSHFDYD